MTVTLPPPLIALTPGDLDPGGVEPLVLHAARAVRAGLRGLLLREPELPDRAYLDLARRMARVLADVDGWLGLHDRPHLVCAAAAQGLHLGFRSLPPAQARPVLGAGAALGLSTHEGDDPAGWGELDYRFFGPVNPTASKAGLLDPTGFEALGLACQGPLPVWAIGGLRPEHVPAAREAGAAGVAVLSGLLGSDDPSGATALYLEALA